MPEQIRIHRITRSDGPWSASARRWEALRKEWKKLWRSRPGRRFQARYARQQKSRLKQAPRPRIGRVTLGVASLVLGLVLLFIPGPAVLFLILGGGLIASESEGAARFLDWSELRLRALWSWMSWKWGGLTLGGRAGVVCLVLGGAATCVYISYRLVAQ